MAFYENAGWLSTFTFAWTNIVVKRGADAIRSGRGMSLEEIPDVGVDLSTETIATGFRKAWEEEKRIYAGRAPRVWRAIVRAYWRPHVYLAILALIEDMFKVASAVFLGSVLAFFQVADVNDDENHEIYLYVWTGLLAVCVVWMGVMHHQVFYKAMRFGMVLRTSVTAALYDQILQLDQAHLPPDGKIINILSNDVQRLDECGMFLHYIYVGIIILVVVYILLSTLYIGWFPAGVGTLVLLGFVAPVQSLFGRLFSHWNEWTVKQRDERVQMLSDLLKGIQVVKYFAWEAKMEQVVASLRAKESHFLRICSRMKACNEAFYFISQGLISLATFGTVYLIGNPLNASSVFASVALFGILRLTITLFLARGVQHLSESWISMKRIEEFLLLPKAKDQSQTLLPGGDSKAEILLEKVAFQWQPDPIQTQGEFVGQEETPHLPGQVHLPAIISHGNTDKSPRSYAVQNVTARIQKGDFVMVCGKVGAGKSSLLLGLLDELVNAKGRQEMIGSCAYVPQSSWLIGGQTIRENILFGLALDEKQYERVVQGVALTTDFAAFPQGDQTIIGERGVTLSGGQKARINLARALYRQDNAIFLLDDVMSAVDNKVGNKIFRFLQQLNAADKITILVTHQLQYLSFADKIMVLGSNGHMSFFGTFNELMTAGHAELSDLQTLLGSCRQDETDSDHHSDERIEAKIDRIEKNANQVAWQEEDRTVGKVTSQTYFHYCGAAGGIGISLLLAFLCIGSITAMIATDRWLAWWTIQPFAEQQRSFYPHLYAGLTATTIVIAISRSTLFFHWTLNASDSLFYRMLAHVIRAPMSFFQSNPHGRVLNRFTKDQGLVDESLPWVFSDAMMELSSTLGSIVLICVINPWVLLSLPPMMISFMYLRSYYLQSSREVKRMEAVTRSPIYSHISTTIGGLVVIRSLRQQERLRNEFYQLVQDNTKCYFSFIAASRWLGFRLDMLAGFFFIVSLMTSVFVLRGTVDAGQIGLGLSYILQLIGAFQWCTRQMAEVENLMTSTERMFHYTRLASESDGKESFPVPDDWPQCGEIVMKDLHVKHPSATEEALKGITCTFKAGEKVGIVGRTGAGKSSLTNAILRIVEPFPANSISIDGIDIKRIDLNVLRSRISIIPQDPFLFRGSLRFNLDPFQEFDDLALWQILEDIQMKKTIEALPDKLDHLLTENGDNFSAGEKQLLCLGRAALRKSKIIIMDEATANVDTHSTNFIQASTKSIFKDTTVLTIAHRLTTVIENDKILFLEGGETREFDDPRALLSDTNGYFYSLVSELGRDALKTMKATIEKQ